MSKWGAVKSAFQPGSRTRKIAGKIAHAGTIYKGTAYGGAAGYAGLVGYHHLRGRSDPKKYEEYRKRVESDKAKKNVPHRLRQVGHAAVLTGGAAVGGFLGHKLGKGVSKVIKSGWKVKPGAHGIGAGSVWSPASRAYKQPSARQLAKNRAAMRARHSGFKQG